MSDLSRLLGDVYHADPATPDDASTDVREPLSGLPEWADDEVLDKAFESWVPGPPADAPAAERSVLTDLAADPVVEVTDESRAAGTEPAEPAGAPAAGEGTEPVAVSPDPVPTVREEPAVPPRVDWQRHDDDIIVGHRRKSLFRR